MRVYWKVHKDDYDKFVNFVLNRYFGVPKGARVEFRETDNFVKIKNFYKDDQYLYLCVTSKTAESKKDFSHMRCNYNNDNWFKNNNFSYMGEYNSRIKKLNKLNNISNEI